MPITAIAQKGLKNDIRADNTRVATQTLAKVSTFPGCGLANTNEHQFILVGKPKKQ